MSLQQDPSLMSESQDQHPFHEAKSLMSGEMSEFFDCTVNSMKSIPDHTKEEQEPKSQPAANVEQVTPVTKKKVSIITLVSQHSSALSDRHVVETLGEVGGVAKKSAGLAVRGVDFLTRNGQICHSTPVPPHSDVAELEYISSLHQCSNMRAIRQDGSVSAQEISAFLMSRHGLVVSAETARNVVLSGLTADKVDGQNNSNMEEDNGDDEQATLDLVELTSALIIPSLIRLRRARIIKSREWSDLQNLESSCPGCRVKKVSNASNTDEDQPVDDSEEQPVDNSDNDDTTKQGPGVEIFSDVLSILMKDATGSSEPKPINEKLVQDILLYYGEERLARDQQLLSKMVECASGPTILLDTDAFVEGLTSDVEVNYDFEREDRISTNFQDVFGDSIKTSDEEFGRESVKEWIHEETLGETCIKKAKGMQLSCRKRGNVKSRENTDFSADGNGQVPSKVNAEYERLFTAPAIDFAADNYHTKLHVLVTWIAFFAFYVMYLFVGANSQYESNRCAKGNENFLSDVFCPFISGTVNSLLVVVGLIVLGTPFVSLASIANGIEGRETALQLLVGIALFLAFLLVPFLVRMEVRFWFSTNTFPTYRVVAVICGLSVTLLQIFNLFIVLVRRRPAYQKLCTWYYSKGNSKHESYLKKAGIHKVDQMLVSALKLHSESLKLDCECNNARKSKQIRSQKLTNYGRALFEFTKLDGVLTNIGGVAFTWRKIWNGTLFTEEGIWISSRLALGTLFQVGVCCVTPFVALYAIRYAVNFVIESEQANDDVSVTPKLAQAITGFGAIAGFLTAVYMTILFLPSVVSTTLKFRRGVIPSMRSKEFLRYRFALDQVTLMYGGMFWGVLVSSAAVAVIVGTFVFLLTWERTTDFFLSLIGNYLGLGLVIITRVLILKTLQAKFFSAFYRKNPLAANIVSLAVECYNAAISVYFMVVRAIKILVIGAIYIGRIDTPLFADGVGVFGPLEIDNWPTVTRKEILLHEAHRHPYLEQLGYLYLMQLRYKDGHFATRPNSAWRLVFVLALMPWLHKYRQLAMLDYLGQEDGDEEQCFRHNMRRSAMLSNDSRSLLNCLSHHSMGKRRGLSAFDTNEEDIERTNRISQIQAELECLQNELRELQDQEDDDSC